MFKNGTAVTGNKVVRRKVNNNWRDGFQNHILGRFVSGKRHLPPLSLSSFEETSHRVSAETLRLYLTPLSKRQVTYNLTPPTLVDGRSQKGKVDWSRLPRWEDYLKSWQIFDDHGIQIFAKKNPVPILTGPITLLFLSALVLGLLCISP